MLEKTCTLCSKQFKAKTIEDFDKYFFKDAKGKHKHNARCKKCCRKEKVKFYQKHPDRMNPKYDYKAKENKCIVCSNTFTARGDYHICCSDECRDFKNSVRRKINKEKKYKKMRKLRQKEIEKCTVRHKHYSEEEKALILRYLFEEKSYKYIAKKLGRTTIGVGKIARQIKALQKDTTIKIK